MLGCLIEKQRTTPDVYPLSLNALRLACNQSTNRDPVVALRRGDDPRRAAPARPPRLDAAGERRAAPPSTATCSTRSPGLARDEQALLAVLMLRGPQTPGELRARTRADAAGSPTSPSSRPTLGRLIEREFAELQPRRPGPEGGALRAPARRATSTREQAPAPAATSVPRRSRRRRPRAPGADRVAERVDRLEQDLAALAGRGAAGGAGDSGRARRRRRARRRPCRARAAGPAGRPRAGASRWLRR